MNIDLDKLSAMCSDLKREDSSYRKVLSPYVASCMESRLQYYKATLAARIAHSDRIAHRDNDVYVGEGIAEWFPNSLLIDTVLTNPHIGVASTSKLVLAYTPMVGFDYLRLVDITNDENPTINSIISMCACKLPCGTLEYLSEILFHASIPSNKPMTEIVRFIDDDGNRESVGMFIFSYDPSIRTHDGKRTTTWADPDENVIINKKVHITVEIASPDVHTFPAIADSMYTIPHMFKIHADTDIDVLANYRTDLAATFKYDR